jgi:signal transduction histidine kinase
MIDAKPRIVQRSLFPAAGLEREVMSQSARLAAIPSERDEALAEVRQLITDLRDAAQDGRDLARRYADVLQNVVDEYCIEFEKRAEAALARLEAAA